METANSILQYLLSVLLLIQGAFTAIVEEVENSQHSNNSSKMMSRVHIEESGQQPTESSNNTTEISVSKTKNADHAWKTHIIYFCTVAVAVEIVIVIVVIQQWQRIRWTLRKLTCPCHRRQRSRRRRREREHRRVEQQEQLEVIEASSSEAEQPSPYPQTQVQIEPVPSTSSGRGAGRGSHLHSWRFTGPRPPQNSGSTSEDEG